MRHGRSEQRAVPPSLDHLSGVFRADISHMLARAAEDFLGSTRDEVNFWRPDPMWPVSIFRGVVCPPESETIKRM